MFFNATCTLDFLFYFSMWFSSFVFEFFLVIFVIALSTAETMLRRRLDQIVFDFNQQSLQINENICFIILISYHSAYMSAKK